MPKPITHKAEVVVDFPEKLFIGSFSQNSTFTVTADAEEITLKLARIRGAKRTIELHLPYALLADVLTEVAQELGERHLPPETQRRILLRAAKALCAAVANPAEG